MTTKTPEAKEKRICELYENGKGAPTISKEVNCGTTTVYYILERNDIDRRSESEACKKYEVNEQIFSSLDKQTSYWIGFLMADGCIRETKRSNGFSLRIKPEDRNHMVKFAEFLGENENLVKDRKDTAGVALYRQQMVDDLEKWGVIKDKTFNGKVKGKANNKHFWRGLIDGDGHIIKPENEDHPSIRITSSSIDLINQFKSFCEQYIDSIAEPYKKKCGSYSFGYFGSKAIKIIDLLYGEDKVSLNRKQKIANKWLENYD